MLDRVSVRMRFCVRKADVAAVFSAPERKNGAGSPGPVWQRQGSIRGPGCSTILKLGFHI